MPSNLRTTLLVTLGSALGAVAVLRLWHHADLAAACYDQDDAFVALGEANTVARRDRWAVRSQIQPWAEMGWAVNMAQAVVVLGVAALVPRGDKVGTHIAAMVTLVVLTVYGDWDLVRGACNPGVTQCGDAKFMLGVNNCANPPDASAFGQPGDPVPTGCVTCDTTVANMATAGLGIAVASMVGVVVSHA